MTRLTNFEIVPLTEATSKGMRPDRDPVRPVVLVVDDEALIADTLAVILARNGITALTAYDGHEALALAQVIPPDLLLTDVMMPGMNGIELAMDIAQIVPDCKVLLFSGQAATKDLLAVSCAAGQDFAIIAKPIHPKELLVRISSSLQSWGPMLPEHGPNSNLQIQSAS